MVDTFAVCNIAKEKRSHRAYGNENWKFDENDLMAKRYMITNDVAI
ncbi:DUF1348 family protein [Sphingobacterium kitahiroshimense]